MSELIKYGKTPRFYREAIVTEKIDGTNAGVFIKTCFFGESVEHDPNRTAVVFGSALGDGGLPVEEYHVYAQSRNNFITPDRDNHGFSNWVLANAQALVGILGPGRHFGEWWGKGIQRGYGADRKYWSLFTGSAIRMRKRLAGVTDPDLLAEAMEHIGLREVPVISTGPFSENLVRTCMDILRDKGSFASPGFRRPEGIIVHHLDAGQNFKVTFGSKGNEDIDTVW